jgi:hypothetical protein
LFKAKASRVEVVVEGMAEVAHLPPYTIIWLGALGGNYSVPEGMNNDGDVVGHAETDIPWLFVDPETGQNVEGIWRHGFLNIDDGGSRSMIDLQDKFEVEGLIPLFDYLNIEGWYV